MRVCAAWAWAWVCLGLAVCLASLFRVSFAQDEGELTIKNITATHPTSRDGDITLVNICFTEGTISVFNESQIILDCYENSTAPTQNDVPATGYVTDEDGMMCSDHTVPLNLFGITVSCGLVVKANDISSNHDTGFATIDIPAEGVCSSAYVWEDQQVLGAICTGNVVKLDGMELIGSSDFVSYFSFSSQQNTPTNMISCSDVLNLETNELVTLCTDNRDVTPAPTGITIEKVNLNYDGYVLSVEGTWTGETIDMVLWQDGIAATATSVSIDADDGKDRHQFIVMEYTPESSATGSSTGEHKDYGVSVVAITSTILEVSWTRNTLEEDSPYTMYKEPPGGPFDTATVECTEGIYCYGYFNGVPPNTYTVTVESIDGVNSVTVLPVLIPETKRKEGIQIRRLEYEWSEGDDTINVTVCFRHRGTRLAWLHTYELTLMDTQGRWQRSNGAAHADLNLICFRAMPVDTRQFQMADKVWVAVVRRDGDNRAVLASGGSEMVAPDVERITPQAIRVSWSGGSGDTFSIKRQGDSTPLATSLACHACTHYIASTTLGETEHLTFVVEAQDAASSATVVNKSGSQRLQRGKVSKA